MCLACAAFRPSPSAPARGRKSPPAAPRLRPPSRCSSRRTDSSRRTRNTATAGRSACRSPRPTPASPSRRPCWRCAPSAGRASPTRKPARSYRVGAGGQGAIEDVRSSRGCALDLAMAAIDGINQRFGRGTIGYGTAGEKQGWHQRREYISDRYRTAWASRCEFRKGSCPSLSAREQPALIR